MSDMEVAEFRASTDPVNNDVDVNVPDDATQDDAGVPNVVELNGVRYRREDATESK